MTKNEWSREFPTEEGLYWFWGHRYGLDGLGQLSGPPELCVVKVFKISGGFMYVADGQFMYESEVLYPHFKPLALPDDLPEIQYRD